MSTIVPIKSFSTKSFDFHITMEIVPKKSSKKPKVGILEPGQPIVSKPRRPTIGIIAEVKTPKPSAKPTIGVLAWSKEECQLMTDSELLSEWRRITDCHTLGCCHCGKKDGIPAQKPIEERWVNAIRSHTSKYGMYRGMAVPKTCDYQRVRNTLKNPISNPYYATKYKGPAMTPEELIVFEENHRQQLLSIDVIKRS